jgi:hypothetical protein
MTIKRTLFDYMDAQGERDLSGWELFRDMAAMTGKATYPSTLLKYLREYVDITGADLECVDHEKSIYHYVPGCGIGSAIIEGVE